MTYNELLQETAEKKRKVIAEINEALEGPCDFDFTLLLMTFLDWKNISRLMIASCVSGITSCSSSGSSFTWSLPTLTTWDLKGTVSPV